MHKAFAIKGKGISVILFIMIQILFWLCLNFITPNDLDKYFIFGGVVLSCLFSFFYTSRSSSTKFLSIALMFTCAADVFLVMLEGKHKTLAMCLFLCAQIAHASVVFSLARSKIERYLQIISRIVLSVCCASAVFIVLKEKTEALFVISLIYFANLALNIIFSFVHFSKSNRARLLSLGFLCFALCDVSIGFDFLINIFSLGKDSFVYMINHLPFSFVHLFYPLSQMLLCLSGKIKD